MVFVFDFSIFQATVFGLITVLGFAYTCVRIGRRIGNKKDAEEIHKLTEEKSKLTDEVSRFQIRFDKLEAVVGDAQDFWSQPTDEQFNSLEHQGKIGDSIPILTVLNFKGGVGKTTICANLAGYFARQGKRVLLIDFDYQGSLTDIVLTHARIDDFKYTSQHLIESTHESVVLRAMAERLSSIDSNLWIYPAFYGFSKTEIQMMFRWLVGTDKEIRFNLHNHLQSSPFQSDLGTKFDLVIIDAPPRMLTGSVNALAASTHVLVPTILDGQSHVATLNTLSVIQLFRQRLNKSLKTIGVVPSMVAQATGYKDREERFIEELERQIPTFHLDGPLPVLKERPIFRKEILAQAGGSEVLYLSSRNDRPVNEIRAMFANLGEYVSQQLNWKVPDSPHVVAMPGQDNSGAMDENRKTATSY